MHQTAADTTQAVDAFMASLQHPAKDLVIALRAAILAADPAISEGVKWNAPSFKTGEYFATMHLRAKTGIDLVLHLGAKRRAATPGPEAVPDPARLLNWRGTDRAIVHLNDLDDLSAKRQALQALLGVWIQHV